MFIFGEKIRGGGVKGAQEKKITDKFLFILAKCCSSVGMDGAGSHFH